MQPMARATGGRGRGIRTLDIQLPKLALYQAELCPGTSRHRFRGVEPSNGTHALPDRQRDLPPMPSLVRSVSSLPDARHSKVRCDITRRSATLPTMSRCHTQRKTSAFRVTAASPTPNKQRDRQPNGHPHRNLHPLRPHAHVAARGNENGPHEGGRMYRRWRARKDSNLRPPSS
jgi:hypothetical protein